MIDKSYLDDVNKRGQKNIKQNIGEMMSIFQKAQEMQKGIEKELEKLAKRIILKEYGDILEGVVLDINLLSKEG